MVVGTAIAAGVGAAYSIYAGERAATAQRQGVRRQADAQKKAETAAVRQQRLDEMAQAKANQKAPDIMTLLGDETGAQNAGVASTMLSDPNAKRRTTLLGG